MGRPTEQRDPETDLLIRDIADTQNKILTLTSGLYQLQTDYMVAKSELSDPARIGTFKPKRRSRLIQSIYTCNSNWTMLTLHEDADAERHQRWLARFEQRSPVGSSEPHA